MTCSAPQGPPVILHPLSPTDLTDGLHRVCVLLFVCVGVGMCMGKFPMCSFCLMCFLVLARRGQCHPLSLCERVCVWIHGEVLCCVQEHRVLQHAELGNGEWKVQQCKSSAPLDSLER